VNAEREDVHHDPSSKYLNNVVEQRQGHQTHHPTDAGASRIFVMRPHHPVRIEVMHMIRKGQMKPRMEPIRRREQFYSMVYVEQSLSFRVCSSRWPYRTEPFVSPSTA